MVKALSIFKLRNLIKLAESKIRNKRFYENNPYCCFCGGAVKATTIDHVPPKVYFRKKHRPDDLIFPACEKCNSDSRLTDTVASFLLRSGISNEDEVGEIEKEKIAKSIWRNAPDAIHELLSDSQISLSDKKQIRKKTQFLGNVVRIGPVCTAYLVNFCAKNATAIYYREFKKSVPIDAKIIVKLISNVDLINKKYSDIAHNFEKIETLRAGNWHTFDQFRFSIISIDKTFSKVAIDFHNNASSIIYITSGIDCGGIREIVREPGKISIIAPNFDGNGEKFKVLGRFHEIKDYIN